MNERQECKKFVTKKVKGVSIDAVKTTISFLKKRFTVFVCL